MSTEFAMDLRLARRKAGLTQRDCAHLLSVPQSRVSAFEKGQLLPSIQQLVQLALIFGRNFESLFSQLAADGKQTIRKRMASLPREVRSYVGTFNRSSTIDRLTRRLASKPDDHGSA